MTCGDLCVYRQVGKETELVGMCNGTGILTPQDQSINVEPNSSAIRVWRING